MPNKLLNRNVNAAFNVCPLSYRSNENLKTISHKNNLEQYFGIYEDFRDKFHLQMTTEGDETVDSDIESIILDLNNLGGLSSSSSLSWSDDYETETSKKVYDELKKLDQVLKGDEPIPASYDKEECQEWMQCFPKLSIFDDDTTPTNSIENLSWHKNGSHALETPLHYDYDMTLISDKNSNYRRNVSNTRMKFNESKPVISQKKLFKGQNGVTNNNLFFMSKPKSLDVDQYLKVSPVLHNKRKQSSKSLLNRNILRDSPNIHPEYSSYSSLPHIKFENLPSLKLQKSSQHIRKKSTYSKTGRNDNHLILPPIDIEQFRSVSAIPGENFKTISPLSVNMNNKQKLPKKKHSNEPVKNLLSFKRPRNILL